MAFGDFTVDRASKKYVLGADGYLKEYANDEPAIEFNADGSYKGVLVEPQSTNDITYSEDFRNTAQAGETRPWIQTQLSFNSNTDIAPDGNQTADEIIPNTTNGIHQLRRLFTTLDGTYTLSVFAKQNGYKNLLLWADGHSGGVGVNLDDLSVFRDTNNDGYTIKQYPDGWVYISTTVTISNTSGSWSVYIYSNDPTPAISFSGDNTNGIFIWGAQLEESPIATSYIPTTTGAVTRVKDDIYLTGASSLIGQTEGTLFVEVDWRSTGVSQWLLSANDGTNNNRLLIYNNTTPELRMFAEANDVFLTDQGESSTGYSGIQKIAFAYADADFELYRNGSSISFDTIGSLSALATLTNIDLGQSQSAGGQANMWIRAVAFFTTRLSDAECEALTTI